MDEVLLPEQMTGLAQARPALHLLGGGAHVLPLLWGQTRAAPGFGSRAKGLAHAQLGGRARVPRADVTAAALLVAAHILNPLAASFPSETRAALQRCFVNIRLARATELAQSGRLLEAEAALVHNGQLSQSAPELDLLARIAARPGRFDDARRRWSAALQLEPDNQIYRQCIAHLTATRRVVRLFASHQYTHLTALIWATIAFAGAVLIYAVRR